MTSDDFLSQVGRQLFRRPTLLLQHSDVIALSTLWLLLPPETQGRHIVSCNGTYRTDGICLQMSVLKPLLLGHLLDFECQYAQLIENGFHTVGQHTQVFRTEQHA